MKRQLLYFAVLSGLTIAGAVYAGGVDAQPVSQDLDGVEGLGAHLALSNFSGNNFNIGLDYKLVQLEMGISLSGSVNESVQSNVGSWHEYGIGGYLGYFYPVARHLFLSGGLQGQVNIITDKEIYNQRKGIDNNPYFIGPYIGLSFEPTMHVALFARVNPISYQSSGYNDGSTNGAENKWGFFDQGVIGISYYLV